MTGKYPFPDDIRDPNRKEPNPFAGEDPSLEPLATADGDETFQVSGHADEYNPVYEAILPDRAIMCTIIGLIGVFVSMSGWLAAFDTAIFGLLYLMPLFSLAGSIPAWLISFADLRAMRRGAMRTQRRGLSAIACFVGALGVANSAVYIAIEIWQWWTDW